MCEFTNVTNQKFPEKNFHRTYFQGRKKNFPKNSHCRMLINFFGTEITSKYTSSSYKSFSSVS